MEGVLRAGVDWFLDKLGLKAKWEQDRASFSSATLSFPWFDDLQSPFRVHCARVGRLEVGLPRQPGSSNRWLTVDASDVNIIIVPLHLDEWDLDIESMEEAAIDARRRQLRSLSLGTLPPACAALLAGGLPVGLWTQKALEGLLRWIRLDVRRVHIRYEDPVTNPRFMFSGGLAVQRFTLGDAPPVGEDAFTRHQGEFSKHALLQASAYWQSYAAEQLAGAPNWEAQMARQPPAREQEEERGTWPAFEVLPLTELEVDLSCPCPRTGARIGFAISAAHVLPRLTHAMFGDLRLLLDLSARWHHLLRQRCEAAARFAALEPPPGAEAGAAARWHRALRCVHRLVRERAPMRHWARSEVHDLLRLQRLYLDLVEQELSEVEAACAERRAVCVDSEVQQCLGQLERVLPIDLLATWRLQAAGHASFPPEDLVALGVHRSSPSAPAYRAASEGAAGGGVSLTLSVRRLGIGVQEIAAPSPLQRIPFDIVSRSAYTSAFQSADWPQSHPVVDRAMGQPGSGGGPDRPGSPGRRHHRSSKPWVYLSTASHFPRTFTAAGGAAAATRKSFEFLLRQVQVRAELPKLDLVSGAFSGELDAMVELSVQHVRLGRPPKEDDGRGETPLLACSSTTDRPSAVHCAWRRGGSGVPEYLRLSLGEWTVGATPANLEDPIFLLADLFPPRSGVEVHRCQNSLLPLALPVAANSVAAASGSLFQAKELSLCLGRLKLYAAVAPAGGGPGGHGAVEALLEVRELDVAVAQAEPGGQDRPWSCSLAEAQFSLPAQSRPSLQGLGSSAQFPGTGPIHAGGCGIAGGLACARVTSVQAAALRSSSPEGRPTMEVSVCVPKLELNIEEGQSLRRLHELARGLLACVPPRQHRCVMASRVRLWYPPAHPAMRQRRMMRKEGPASSSSDSGDDTTRGSRSCGHWSCDVWAELLANGALELYSHPRQRTPIYSLWPLEVRGGGDPYSTPAVASQQNPQRRVAREMEVRIALPGAAGKTGAEGNEASPMPQSLGSLPSAWIYLRCVDQLSQHWVHKWRLLDEALRRPASFGEVPSLGAASARRRLRPRAWRLQCTVLDSEVGIFNAFEPSIRAQCQGLCCELDLSRWHLQVAVAEFAMENMEHDASDRRRYLVAAMADNQLSTDAGVEAAGSVADFLLLTFSPTSGGQLQVVSLQLCLDPLLVLRLAHAWHALTEFCYGVQDWPWVSSWRQEASDCFRHAVAVCSNALEELSAPQDVDAEPLSFSCSLPLVDVCCVQSFTSSTVGVVELQRIDARASVRLGGGPVWEAASCSLGSFRVCGHTGRTIWEVLPAAAPEADAVAAAVAESETLAAGEEAMGVQAAGAETAEDAEAAAPCTEPLVGAQTEEAGGEEACCMRVECRQEQRASVLVLRLEVVGGPSHVDWRHEECSRLLELSRDLTSALSWSVWKPSRCRPVPSVAQGVPLAEQECLVQANIYLRLPSIHVGGGDGSQCPSIDVKLGEVRVTSAIEEDFQPPSSCGAEGEATSGFLASVLRFRWDGALAARLARPGRQSSHEGKASRDESSSAVSDGASVTATLAIQAALEGPRPPLRRASLQLDVLEVLALTVPCALFQALQLNARHREVMASAPGIAAQRLGWLWRRLLARACSAVCALDLVAGASLAGFRLELLDAADRPWLTAELLDLTLRHRGLRRQRSEGRLDFAVGRLGVRAALPEVAEPLEVLQLRRQEGEEQDVRVTLTRKQKSKGTGSESEFAQAVDTWEVQVAVGAPTLRISPFLVAYLTHITQCVPSRLAGGGTSPTATAAPSWNDGGPGAVKMRACAAVLARRAQAMAAVRHHTLLAEMAHVVDMPAARAGGSGLAARAAEVSPVALCAAGHDEGRGLGPADGDAVFVGELQCGTCSLELLRGVSTVVASVSARMSSSLSARQSRGGTEASWTLSARECKLEFSGHAGPRLAVSPFGISACIQRKHLADVARVAPPEPSVPKSPGGREVVEEPAAKVKVNIQIPAVSASLHWQDILLVEEWLEALRPAQGGVDASSRRAHWWCEPPRLPAGGLKLQEDTAPRHACRDWIWGWIASLGHFGPAEFTVACGGLSFELQDAEGLAIKASARPMEVHCMPPSQAASGRHVEHQSQAVVELEAWNAWARVWEPLLEPCEITLALSLSPRQRTLSVHCAQVRLCIKLQHLQDFRRRLHRDMAERCAATTRWRARQAKLWRCSPSDAVPRWPLALGDLGFSSGSARQISANVESDRLTVEDASEAHEFPRGRSYGGPLASLGASWTEQAAGPPLRVRNLTGCTLVLQESGSADEPASKQSSDSWCFAPGEEREVGRVGAFGVMDALLQTQCAAAQSSSEVPIRVQMACAAPGVRALQTSWPGVLLWQEVVPCGSGVLCRFRSPVLLSNQTPLDLEIEYGDGMLERSQVGDVVGLNLAALAQGSGVHGIGRVRRLQHAGLTLRVRPISQEYGDWSNPMSVPFDDGAGPSMVVSCGPCCELVAEASLAHGPSDAPANTAAGEARLSLTLRPRCSICNMLPIPFQVRAAASCWPSASEQPALEIGPGETKAALVSTLGQSHLWLSLSLGGCQGSWSLPQCVPLSSRPESPTLLTWDVKHTGDPASAFQVEVRSLPALHGQGLAPRIVLALCIRHVVLLQCPFLLRLLAPVNPGAHMTRLAPVSLGGSDGDGPYMWLVHSKVFELHSRCGPGPSVAVHADLALESGSLAARAGEHDVTIAKAQGSIVPFAESETICLTILPRFWVMNHLRCDLELKQVHDSAERDGDSPLVVPAGTGTSLHFAWFEEGLPAVVMRPLRPAGAQPDPWSGAVGLCWTHRCSLALRGSERLAEGAVWVEAVRQAGGQWALHISQGAAAEIHVENHTHMALHLRQLHFEHDSLRLPPLTATAFAWRDALELARCAAAGRQAALQLQSERWRQGEWLSLDPYVPCRCSARHGDTALYVHTRREGSTHVVVVTTNQHIEAWQEPNYVDGNPSNRESRARVGQATPSRSKLGTTRHLRGSCAELSVSLVGAHHELFRLTALSLAGGSDRFEQCLKLLCSIDFLRLDHLAPGAGLPTLIRTAPTSAGPFFVVGASRELEPRVPLMPCVAGASEELCFEPCRCGEVVLEYVDARASELFLSSHVRSVMGSALPFLVAVLGGADEEKGAAPGALGEEIDPQVAVTSYCGTHASMVVTPPAMVAPPTGMPLHVRIGDLRLSPLDVGLAISLRDFDPSVLGSLCFTPAEVKRALRRLSSADIPGERLSLSGVEWHGVAASYPALADVVRLHYTRALRDQLHAALAAGGGATSEDAYGVADYLLQGLHSFVGALPENFEEADNRDGQCPGPNGGLRFASLRAPPSQRLAPPGTGMCLGRLCGRSLALQVLSEDDNHPSASSSARPASARSAPAVVAPRSRAPLGQSCGDVLPLEPGVDVVTDGLRSAGQALFSLFLKPWAGVLGPTPEDSAEAMSSAATGPSAVGPGTAAEVRPPPPRLLRGPHRLARPRRHEDEEAQRLLADLAFDLGADTCYEDHALSNDPSRVIILTDSELVLARVAPPRVERRWALDGVDPTTVGADGLRVHFSAEMGVTDNDELRVGPTGVRCATVAAALGLATALRAAATEARLAGISAHRRVPESASMLVSL